MASLNEQQINEAAKLMAKRFAKDPGIVAQMRNVDNPQRILNFQCKGQIRAFAKADCVTLYEGGPSFMLGYSTDNIPMERVIGVLQDASVELMEALAADELEKLQLAVAPVAAISDEFWYLKYFPEQPVYVLQVIAIEEKLKGTGAFRKMIDPVIKQCETKGLSMVLQTHNPANVAIYEHFGFSIVEQVDSEDIELTCYNMARSIAK